MIFNKNKDGAVIYCKNGSYKKLFDNNYYCHDKQHITYYKGYLIHHDDGPAIEYKNGPAYGRGPAQWYFEGKRHRKDGPAVEWYDGDKEWYLNGVKYIEEEYWKIIESLKSKVRVLNDI